MQITIMTCKSALLKRCLVLISGLIIGPGVLVCQADDNLPEAATIQPSEFKYNDDWALVSAPPPPGPYQSINVDPRVPGQESNLPPPTTGLTSHPPATAQQVPGRLGELPPTGAGEPGQSPMGYGPPSRQVPYGHGRPPGYSMPRERWQGGSVPGQDYYRAPQSPYTGYRGPGYATSPWSATPPVTAEEEVPPPPVYDRMNAPYPYQDRQYFPDGMR
jgi:hypothetical protein